MAINMSGDRRIGTISRNMKYQNKIWLVLLLLFLMPCMSIGSLEAKSKQENGQAIANKISSITSKAIYNLDKDQLLVIVRNFIEEHPNVKALAITDSISQELLLTYFHQNEVAVYGQSIPEELTKLEQFSAISMADGEAVATIAIYYKDHSVFTIKKVARLHELAQEMKYLDEVLTTSVLSYTFTQDKKWLNRYNEHEPKLGKIFDEAISHKQRKDAVVVDRINNANDQLIAMEMEAIDLVGKGKGQQALNILNSSNYREQKKQFAQALKVYFLTLEESFNEGLISTDTPTQIKAKLNTKEQNWVETHTVKVGIEEWPPIVFTGDDGGAAGLAGGILELLTNRTGIKFEIVSDAWDPLLKGLRERTIDLLPATYYTDERATYGLYSKPYFLMKEFVYVQSENQEISSLDDLAHKKIAVVKGYGTIPKLKRYLPNAEIVETPDLLTSINAVLNGDVDALVEAQMAVQNSLQANSIVGLKGISQTVFPSSPIHLFSRLDEPLLQSILQKGLDTISVEERRAEQNKWLGLDGGEDGKQVELTLDEEQWLSKHANIRLGDDFAWPPFSFRDERGNFSGIAGGYMEAISDRLGVKIKPVWGLTWSQVLKQVQSGDVDLLPAVARTPEREKFLNFTKPYISFPVVIATRKEGRFVDNLSDLKGLKVGVIAGYITEELLSKEHPGLTLALSKNLEEGMLALQDGKIDAFVDNLGSITHLIDKKGLKGVKIAAPTEYRFDLSIGVRKDWPELVPILDKALDTIDDKERTAIKNSWMAIQVQFGLKIKTVLMWVVPGIAVAGLIIFMISIWNRRMFQEITQRKKVEGELRDAMEVISSSIQYASHIQHSILPATQILDAAVKDWFIIWEPRDVVGGDMYWCRTWGSGDLIMLGDCTGHGVPGAFMTLISNGALDGAAMETAPGDPAALLQRIHQFIQTSLSQDKEKTDEGSDDGIELGACFINRKEGTLIFAGARFELFILENGDISVIKGVKAGLGYRGTPRDVQFINHTIETNENQTFYMTSDGLIDQVGGEKRRGFGKKRFKALLTSNSDLPLVEQKDLIQQALTDYQGNQKRRDDVATIGFRCLPTINQNSVEKDVIEMEQMAVIGFKPIDDDHKHLFAMISKFNLAIVHEQKREAIVSILDELVDYTVWHFRHEDRLMQKHNYPEHKQHKEIHNTLVEQVAKIQNDVKNSDVDVSKELLVFLMDWLNEHINKTDKKLADFLSSLENIEPIPK
jgi:hemerythrin-like metal-binding protein